MNYVSVINNKCEETPSCCDIDSCPPLSPPDTCLVKCFIFPPSSCLNVPFSSSSSTEEGAYPRQKLSRLCTTRNKFLLIAGLMSLWDSHYLPAVVSSPVPRTLKCCKATVTIETTERCPTIRPPAHLPYAVTLQPHPLFHPLFHSSRPPNSFTRMLVFITT